MNAAVLSAGFFQSGSIYRSSSRSICRHWYWSFYGYRSIYRSISRSRSSTFYMSSTKNM